MKKIFLVLMLFLPLTVLSLSLDWQTPTQREDNSALALSEISGFAVYCGVNHGEYTDKTFVSGATLPTTTFNDLTLPSGTHYCVVTTLDTDGRESSHSNMVTINVNGKAAPKPPMIAANTIINVVLTLAPSG